ncbi:MAG: aconitase X catalytic domain-containing protein [Gemmatimonadota bacterium]|nr:aconitase X catalytic domain-containing protein [Gemmatimonadota bacterium]
MKLTCEEKAMLAGEMGPAAATALARQMEVGTFFRAVDFAPVQTVHAMADIEALAEPGLRYLEETAAGGARFRVPVTTNPRSVDFAMWRDVGQDEDTVNRERRIMKALTAMGALPCNTCINYQTVDPPRFGEHLGWGDTGTVIFANSVAGARSNFEAGPAAVWAGLTGRVPRYGFHLPDKRRGSVRVFVEDQPRSNSDWGALGCVVGRQVDDYCRVPVFEGIQERPSTDDLKHLGAALASYGSLAMFHMLGVTPEARTAEEAYGGPEPEETIVISPGTLRAAYDSFQPEKDAVDLVVCGTPQLSLFELQSIAELLRGRRVPPDTTLYLTTNYQIKALADRMGYTDIVENAGGRILAGVCFYIMNARVLQERFHYRTLVTNSAKLANIISGYGYNPIFRPVETCIDAAVTGRVG